MEQITMVKALEDIELIKGIMQRTSSSLMGLSRTLLWWGGTWLAVVVLLSILSSPLVALSPLVANTTDHRTLLTAFLLLLVTFAVLILGVVMGLSTYRQAIHKQAVSTLTHGLVAMWGVVLLISFVFPFLFALLCAIQQIDVLAPQIASMNIGASTSATRIFSSAGLFTPYAHAMEVWLFALALYATRAVTRLAFIGWLGLAFLIIGLLYPFFGASFGNYFHPGPYTLLILGCYLEMRRRKGTL